MSAAVKEKPSLPLCREIRYKGIRCNDRIIGFWTSRPYSACLPNSMFVKTVKPTEEKELLEVGTILPVLLFEEEDNILLCLKLLLDLGMYTGTMPTPNSESVGVLEWSARYKTLPRA